MKIYTRTGDKGFTGLATGERVKKTDPRLMAYGTVDELNSFVGLLRAAMLQNPLFSTTDKQLEWVQNRLFDMGGILAGAPMPWPAGADTQLEEWIDAMQAELPELKAFILPAGSELICRCHVCRTIGRRLEREVLLLNDTNSGEVSVELLRFLNRLSDYCFVLARWIGKNEGILPVLWKK